jgi:hypothetical protein
MGRFDKKVIEDYTLSDETAASTLQSVLDFYEVGTTPPTSDDPDELRSYKAINEAFESLVLAIRRGELEVKEDNINGFHIIQHIKNTPEKPIIYRELKADDAKIKERYDMKTQSVSAAYALLGKVSGLGEPVMRLLKGQDKKNAMDISLIFFMA